MLSRTIELCRPNSISLEGLIGGIQTDAYASCRFFAKQNSENEHILCWSHVRVQFKLAFDMSKNKDAGWFVSRLDVYIQSSWKIGY